MTIKASNFPMFPQMNTVVLRLRTDFVERKIVDRLSINKYTANWSFNLVDFGDWAKKKYDTTMKKLCKS